MRVKITSGSNVWKVSNRTESTEDDGLYEGRILNQAPFSLTLSDLGSMPVTLQFSIRNNDSFIDQEINLWGAEVEISISTGEKWRGKVTSFDSDGSGTMHLVVTEKSAPELTIQFPDEIARLVSLDENFHVSAINVTLPLAIGGNADNPILLNGILVDKTQGIYLLCVGEIHQVVKIYRGTEEITEGFESFTGTATQSNYKGFAYIKLIDEDLRKNDDGTYAQVSAEVIGIKLGDYSPEECRNGARFLFWLLKTTNQGINGWGLGIDETDIDEESFSQAISDVDDANLKLDGVIYFRQLAQSWIDQICLAIRGNYNIGTSGKRRLQIDRPTLSIQAQSIMNYFETCWELVNTLFDTNDDAPDFSSIGYGEYLQLEQLYFDQISIVIGVDGLFEAFVSNSSNYTERNMTILRHGFGAYTGRVYNKGRLEFDYNPLTAQFMQSTYYQDSDSISQIGEQNFSGQTYLVRDAATAQKLLEYTCKRSVSAAEKLMFETNLIPSGIVPGSVISVSHFLAGVFGDWKITSLNIGEYKHTIEAERYLVSIFDTGLPSSIVDWSRDASISSTVLPGNPSGLTLETAIDYDSQGDGSARSFIEGNFTAPQGRYIGAAVFWGEGIEPEQWIPAGSIRGTSFRVGPVMPGHTYSVRVELFNQSGASSPITASIVAGEHEEIPPTPTVDADRGLGSVLVSISLSTNFAALLGFEIQRQKSDGTGAVVLVKEHFSFSFIDDSETIRANYLQGYQYRVRSISRSRKYSNWSSWSTAVSARRVEDKDLTDLPIIGKTFMTNANVGAAADGVKITEEGIEKWSGGFRTVFIPKDGSPEFAGTIYGLAGVIGGCVIEESSIRSTGFVSGHSGWKITSDGRAFISDLVARGSIETVVFKTDETTAMGGYHLVKPGATVVGYDYDEFFENKTASQIESYYGLTDELLDEHAESPELALANYNEFYLLELESWMICAKLKDEPFFIAGIDEGSFDCAANQATHEAYWECINLLLDEIISPPLFDCTDYHSYSLEEQDYWLSAGDLLEEPVFSPSFDPNDIKVSISDTETHVFSADDVIRIKAGLSDYWAIVSEVGEDYLNLTHRHGARFDITAGQAIVNYGSSGSGGILLDGQSPLIDIFTHDGEPWKKTNLLIRQGNLNGWGGISSNIHGIAIGRPDSDYLLATKEGITLTGKVFVKPGSNVMPGADHTQSVISSVNIDNAKVNGQTLIVGGFINTEVLKVDYGIIVGTKPPANADHTQTTINGGLVTTGTVQVVQGGSVAAGVTGNTSGDTAVRFWAGSTFEDRATAPFRVTQEGKFYSSEAEIEGIVKAKSGGEIGGFNIGSDRINAGSGSTYTAVSSGTYAFWAGDETASSAPFSVTRGGAINATDGEIGRFSIDTDKITASSTPGAGHAIVSGLFASDYYHPEDAGAGGYNAYTLGSVEDTLVNAYGFKSTSQPWGGSVRTTIKALAKYGNSIGGTQSGSFWAAQYSTSEYAFTTNGKIRGIVEHTSDNRIKSNIAKTNTLSKLKQLNVYEWEYDDNKVRSLRKEEEITEALREKNGFSVSEINKRAEISETLLQPPKQRHVGAMAGEFNKLFGVNAEDETGYSVGDAIGVALRAIQELSEIVDKQKETIETLCKRLDEPIPEYPKEPEYTLTQEEQELIDEYENSNEDLKNRVKKTF